MLDFSTDAAERRLAFTETQRLAQEAREGLRMVADGEDRTMAGCARCGAPFIAARSNQRYCTPACAKAATRNRARGPREVENASRNASHYERATRLCHDFHRSPLDKRADILMALLSAASGSDAGLRNILTDPALLSAAFNSPIGKLYPDTRYCDVQNIAKTAYAFCSERWGLGVRAVLRAPPAELLAVSRVRPPLTVNHEP